MVSLLKWQHSTGVLDTRWQKVRQCYRDQCVNLVYDVTTAVVNTGAKSGPVVDAVGAFQLRISSRIFEKFKIVLLG